MKPFYLNILPHHYYRNHESIDAKKSDVADKTRRAEKRKEETFFSIPAEKVFQFRKRRYRAKLFGHMQKAISQSGMKRPLETMAQREEFQFFCSRQIATPKIPAVSKRQRDIGDSRLIPRQ